jgi:hypothetical protein
MSHTQFPGTSHTGAAASGSAAQCDAPLEDAKGRKTQPQTIGPSSRTNTAAAPPRNAALNQACVPTKTPEERLQFLVKLFNHNVQKTNCISTNELIRDAGFKVYEACVAIESNPQGLAQRREIILDELLAQLINLTLVNFSNLAIDELESAERNSVDSAPQSANDFKELTASIHKLIERDSQVSKMQKRLFGLSPLYKKGGDLDFLKSDSTKTSIQSGFLVDRYSYISDKLEDLVEFSEKDAKKVKDMLDNDFFNLLDDLLMVIYSLSTKIFQSHKIDEPNYYSQPARLTLSAGEFSKSLVDQITYVQNLMSQQVENAKASVSNTHIVSATEEQWLQSMDAMLVCIQGLAQEMSELAPKPLEKPGSLIDRGFLAGHEIPQKTNPSKQVKKTKPSKVAPVTVTVTVTDQDTLITEVRPTGSKMLRDVMAGEAPADSSRDEEGMNEASTESSSRFKKRQTSTAHKLVQKVKAEFKKDCEQCSRNLEIRPPDTTLNVFTWLSHKWEEQEKIMRNVLKNLKIPGAKTDSVADTESDVQESKGLIHELEAAVHLIHQGLQQQRQQASRPALIKQYERPQAQDWKELLNTGHIAKVSRPVPLPSDTPNTVFEFQIDPVQDGAKAYSPVFLHIHTALPVNKIEDLKKVSEENILAAHLKSNEQKNLGKKNQGNTTVHRSKVGLELLGAFLKMALPQKDKRKKMGKAAH